MKALKLTAGALALATALTCISAFSQDAPAPATEAAAAQAAARNPRAGYTPLADGGRQTSANKTATLAAAEATSAADFKTFTSGAGDSLFKFTISTHGN